MSSIITDPKQVNENKWNDFVKNHPDGNIFHTPEFVMLYQASAKYEPLVLFCLNEGKIIGLLVSVIQREYSGFIGFFSSRIIVWGGPLVNDNNADITSLILSEFDKICNKKAIYSQFRNMWNVNSKQEIFKKHGYVFEEHLDILFDLSKGQELLWKEIHPTRRKQINRGIKRGIKTIITDKLKNEDLKICYSILKKVYKEAKLPFPDIQYFNNATSIFQEKGYFNAALAYFQNEIIGFRFFLCYNGLIYDWYAGSRKEHYNKYPNDILPWEILKWGSENGYKTFDFGGAGKPGISYGVRDYKIKFGGTLVNYGRYKKVYKPILFLFSIIGFKIWQLLSIMKDENSD